MRVRVRNSVTEYEIPCTSQRSAIIQRAFVEDNMVVRVSGDTIALSPPLIASEGDLGDMVERIGRMLRTLC